MTPAMLALALSALWPPPREVAPAALLRRELAQTFGAVSAGRGKGVVRVGFIRGE